MPLPYELEELRAATHELIARNELRSCYIRPLAYRGYGQMGLNPLDAPVDVCIAVWPWGAYLGEEGKRVGVRAQGVLLAADQPRLADPARQGQRPVPQQRAGEDREPQGRLRGGDPARRQGPRVRGLGREHLRRPRRDASTRRRRPPSILDGITACRCSRSRATSGTRWSSATSRGPSSTSPTRSSARARRPRSCRSARSTTT